MGLLGATVSGVGAVVGGGILVLSGAAFEVAGPSAIVAILLNGLVAILAAVSFAEMTAAFPQAGGIYAFAKRVFSVRAAFVMGWLFYFASAVAGTLYALGFAQYTQLGLARLYQALLGRNPAWLEGFGVTLALLVLAVGLYSYRLVRVTSGGNPWVSWGKIVVFALLIVTGLAALPGVTAPTLAERFEPFFAGGASGVLQAMGFTFITVQGFWVLGGLAGRMREPAKTLPRAMVLSLAIALAIYVPLLFVIVTVGTPPGTTIQALSAQQPTTVVAVAAEHYLGPFGFWLVVAAAVLATLSALRANLMAASLLAYGMARDRTLPRALGQLDEANGTPSHAVLASGALVLVLGLTVSNTAAAGAAASLIFLLSFAVTHAMSMLLRRRAPALPFRTPLYPYLPVVGGLTCLGLALFQGFHVPSAGLTTLSWLALGVVVYLLLFAPHARLVEAAALGRDPDLARLRGKSPLVLVPIANPANAPAMVELAGALAPPVVGRVLLLSVVRPTNTTHELANAQAVLRESLAASFAEGLYPEALTTVADEPWREIARVTQTYRCESLLLGLSRLEALGTEPKLDELLSEVDNDVVVLRARPGWHLEQVRRVLVPVGGRGDQDLLRARLLGSLSRTGKREITFLRVLPQRVTGQSYLRAKRKLEHLADDEAPGARVRLARSDDPIAKVAQHAEAADLVVLGLQRLDRHRKTLGEFALELSRRSDKALVMISRRG
jgi:amino acid transporter